MLTQDGRTVSYASRSLSPTKQRYSQIEREALGIIWGVQRFHTYLFGRNFTVVTDHKPLIPIFGKTKGRTISPHCKLDVEAPAL